MSSDDNAGRSRAQASVLAVALLLGITALGVGAVLLVGAAGLDEIEQNAANRQAENAFTQLDAQASQVALGASDVQTVDLGQVRDSGQLSVQPTGRMVIVTEDGVEYLNQTMGTVRYENREEVVAYQGGGVWRGNGANSTMVSPPEFHYRGGTLTLPLVVTSPGGESTGGDRLRLAANGSRERLAPGVIENQVLTVRIESAYYRAWGQYFEDRVEGVSVRYDDPNETATIQLAELDIDGDYSTGVVAQGSVTVSNGNPTVYSEVVASGSVSGDIQCDEGTGSDCYTAGLDPQLVPLDIAIETLVNASEGDDPDANVGGGPTTLTAGAYYSEGFLLDSGTLTIDLAAGDVTLFVDGNIGLDNQRIRVINGEGTNHTVRVFTNGDFAMAKGNAGVTVESGNATRFQLFGTSEHHFGMGQSNTNGYTGTVYAPRYEPANGENDAADEYGLNSVSCAETDICIGTGSGNVKGALIGGSVSVQQSSDFAYDDNLSTFEPTLPDGTVLPPPITFLHVSVNRVDVSGAGGGDVVPIPDPELYPRLEVYERGSDAYLLSARQTTPAEYVDEYRWDVDDDGTLDATTTDPTLVVECGPGGVALDCSNLPEQANVTVVNAEFGVVESDSDNYAGAPSVGSPSDAGGGGGGATPAPTGNAPNVTITGTSVEGKYEYDVSYDADDGDGDLDELLVEVSYDKKGGNSDTETTVVDLSGASASGTVTLELDEKNSNKKVNSVTVTASDIEGNTDTDTDNSPS